MRYRLEHGLKARPVDMNIWLSLDDVPFAGEPVTPAAGNQSLIWEVSEESIVLSNDTCSDVFVRLTAWVDTGDVRPTSGPDAGSEPGVTSGPNTAGDADAGAR
jgi:hypothetical protein